MGLLSLASSLGCALAVTVSAISFSEHHTTGSSCECQNFKTAYANGAAECGAALEWNDEGAAPTAFLHEDLAVYDRVHDTRRSALCGEMKKLDTNKCVNSLVGKEGGTWCYVDAGCSKKIVGRNTAGKLAYKMCSTEPRSPDARLRDAAPEELAALAKSSNVSLAFLVRLAYTGVRADREELLEWDVEDHSVGRSEQKTVYAKGGEPVWFDTNEAATPPLVIIQGQKVWSVDETSLTFRFEIEDPESSTPPAPSGHMTGSSCACLNWRGVFEHGEGDCALGLQWWDDPQQPVNFHKATLAPYDKAGTENRRSLCRSFRRLDTDKCVNSQFGQEWGTWCYVEAGCSDLNGGHNPGDGRNLPFKMCGGPPGDARLRESSPEELVALAKSSRVSLGWLVRAAYVGVRADRDGVLEEWNLENQTVPDWARDYTTNWPAWFDTNDAAEFPILLIHGQKLWSVNATSLTYRFEVPRAPTPEEAVPASCLCRNFREVYEGDRDACGAGLELRLTEDGAGAFLNLTTPAMYVVDAGKKSDICARYAKLDTDRCVNAQQGRNWGTWCYTSPECPNLNGGRQADSGLAWKKCTPEPRLRDYSPEELAEFAKSKGIHFGELVRMAYAGCRADKDGHANLADFNGTIPADVAKGARGLSEGDGDRPAWFDTSLEARFPIVVVHGGKAWTADEAGLTCLVGCS